MSVPQDLLDLMQRFRDNERHYRDMAYNETETRRELIDPFFKALGWDMDNTKGFSEKYKEVVHEARVKVGRATKAPDYAFRVGGQPIFFVEAKKPAVRLAAAPEPAYQVRRYAWSAKLPVSILTNFAEFALYDCRFKPAHSDHLATARVMYFTYEEYPDRWAELAALLSPRAVQKGALDRFVESTKSKRGTQAVDDAFLAEIEGWREALARNFALRNPLSVRQLNFAVQKTIDRIIFLRIAEDRGFEPYHRLGDVAATGGDLYRQLGELFRQADNRYNAGLFYFEPEAAREDNVDDFTLDLRLDDRVLKEIIGNLYYPESPYAFDALPADILGQVYERFLGSVIRLTPAGRAKVEEKPEVKKAGGVYYTPTYIVDYIVAHTVGRLVERRSWREVRGLDARGARRYAPLRVVDPACGSGTFLLQAYQFLLDWYLAQYVDEGAEIHARAGRLRAIIGGGAESWRLTTEERKEILLTHIYGVDIDPQAVEVTKLSLLLKVLEGEDAVSLGTQLKMSLAGEARVLPDLTANIRCGNSLIGSDFYRAEQLSLGLVDEETMYRINAFDWAAPSGFPQAMA
ncbi:MAG: type I restriction endonuclease, partial [Anaerolineales bacterium]